MEVMIRSVGDVAVSCPRGLIYSRMDIDIRDLRLLAVVVGEYAADGRMHSHSPSQPGDEVAKQFQPTPSRTPALFFQGSDLRSEMMCIRLMTEHSLASRRKTSKCTYGVL